MMKYKVLPDWLQKCDSLGYKISNWCRIVDCANVSCEICQKNIFCGTKGFQAVTQHASTTMHKNNATQKLCSKQMLLKKHSVPSLSTGNINIAAQSAPSQMQLFYKNDDVIKAEIIWTLKCVQSNIAANVNTDMKQVLTAMVPHYITENFQLSRTKLSYLITEALGPYFRKENLEDARKSYYSLLYDETTNSANKKELQFQLRYWSEAEKQIVCQHLQTVFIGHATADDITLHIEKVLNDAALCKSKLLMLGSDGPNVNKKVWNVMNSQLIEERGYGLIDIGTCNIHVVHNAFHKGLEEYGDTACELIQLIYHFFKKYPSRWEDYVKCQIKKDVPQHRFIKHVGNRWLTVGPASQRILEQWKAIVEYFLNYIPVHDEKLMKSEKYKQLLKIIKYNDIKVEMNFIVEASELYSSFLLYFQHSEPLVHILGTELMNVLKVIAGRICKPESLSSSPNLLDRDQLLKATEIECGDNTRLEVNSLGGKQKLIACCNMQNHYMSAHNYIYEKAFKANSSTLLSFKCFQIKNIKDQESMIDVSKLCDLMPILGLDKLNLKDEWRTLQASINVPKETHLRIDHFWKEYIYETNDLGYLKYPSINKLAKAALALSHGNSDVERGFSISRRILSEEKSSMSERLLNDKLTIRDAIKKYEHVGLVPITSQLLKMAYGARKSYEIYLEEEKRIKEERIKAEKEKEEKRKADELEKEKCATLKDSIDILEEKVKLISKEKIETQSSVDVLLTDANAKLKEAIKKKDFEAIRVAQGMMEGSLKLREKAREHENKEGKINKLVNKRKLTLIEKFIKKNRKN